MMRTKSSLALLGVCLFSIACGQEEPVPAPEPESAPHVGATTAPKLETAPFDVGQVIRRVHFSFREEGERFNGGHSTYGVDVDREGVVRFKPVSYPRVSGLPEEHPAPGQPRRQHPPKIGAPLVLETSAIGRDGTRLMPTEMPVVAEDGHLVRGGRGVSEELHNEDAGLEVSWWFAERPQGRGDLVVRQRASGLEFVLANKTGLHFRDPVAQLGVRYGHATWIDANGKETSVLAHWDGRDIVMAVPADVVDASAFPAVLDPIIGPETSVDVVVTGPASGYQGNGSAAYSGSTYFVVWQDNRSESFNQVYGTRVSSAGVVQDPNGIAISLSGTYADSPSVVWDGTNFLVVYSSSSQILGRRFTTAGVAVDAVPCALANAGGGSYQPFAYNNGTTTFVAWYDYRNSGEGANIYGTRVSGCSATDGSMTGIAISRALEFQYNPRVTYGGGNWFIVWEDYRNQTTNGSDLYGARVRQSDGMLLDSAGIAISSTTNYQYNPWVASNGTDYFAVWTDDRNGNYDVFGARVTSAGVVTDTTGILINSSTSYEYNPSVAFNSGTYQVMWEDYRGYGIYGNRVTTAGTLVDGATGIRLDGGSMTTYAYQPRIFPAGTNFYVVWNQSVGDSGQDIYGTRMTSATAPAVPSCSDAPGDLLANSAQGQTDVDIASNGTSQWMVVWVDDRGGNRAIYGVRVNSSGTPTDATGILISSGGQSEQSPAVAWNGTHYLVVWIDYRGPWGVWGERINSSGAALVDATNLQLFVNNPPMYNNQPYEPDVTSDGAGNWFVAWYDYRNSATSSSDIYGGRVSSTGIPPAADTNGILISGAAQWQQYVELGYGGGYYLACWQDYRSSSSTDLYCARVNTSGALQDAAGIGVATGSGYIDYNGAYDIAYLAPNFWVVYSENSSIYRARITAATGAIVDAGILIGGCCRYQPSISYDSDLFVVAYNQSASFGFDIRATRLDSTGADLDSTDFDISVGQGANSRGPVVRSITDTTLVAYTRYDGTAGVTSDRVRMRLISRSANGDACTIGLDCLSNNCVDGVCCNTACGGTTSGDCQACSTATGASANGVCTTLPSTYTCRASAGTCDVAENCSGTGTSCPADGFSPSSTVCRASAGVCDPAENCTGSAAACPADTLSGSSVTCRASAGVCDPAETCTGSSASCPSDALSPSSTVCRASAGTCDVAENCSGSSASCPADALAPSSTVCRASAGTCDPAENCSGTSATCPADLLSPATTVCRASAGVCDVAENCTGSAAACPSNGFSPSSTVCRAAVAGGCDVAENCSGSSATCPADVVNPATTVCRAAAGVCDVAENCTGSSNTCPADVLRPSSFSCRAAADLCDAAENCTGSSSACPADAVAAAGTTCRGAAGTCDAAEVCNGSAITCPANVFLPATTECRAAVAGGCDVAENCSGTSASCPADVVNPATTVCRASAGVCDVAENCTGTSATCPTNAFQSASTVCRASAGVCDVAETCSGTSATCPANLFEPATTVCRAAADLCDADENCSGTSASCGPDNVLPAGTLCRAAAGGCDVGETCSGSALSCPPDVFMTAGSVCRAAAGACDIAETCSGSAAACPTDALQSSSFVCRASTGDCDLAELCSGSSVACPTDAIEPDGTSCADGDPCTANETCLVGACQGGGPSISFDPGSITFAPTFSGMMSAPTTVTVTNLGEADLSITSISSTTTEFPTTPPMAPPIPITAVGGNFDMDVVFAPGAGSFGTVSDTITLDTATCSFDLPVSGNAMLAGLDIDPSDGDFGDVDIDGAGMNRNYVITNTGTTDIVMEDISIETGPDFTMSLVTPANLPATLDPTDTVVLTVTCDPSAVGPVTDIMKIEFTPSGGSLITVDFNLTCNGISTVPDAGPPDVGGEVDAGQADAWSDQGLDDSYYTCQCRTGGRSSSDPTAWMLLSLAGAAFFVVIRRRRR